MRIIVECRDDIKHFHITSFIRRKQMSLQAIDRRLLQCCYEVLNGQPQWVWTNARVEVHGRELDVVFCSGDQCNKYVVYLNSNDEISAQCTGRGLRLTLMEGFRSVLNWISTNGSRIIGAIAGARFRALTYQ